VFVSYIRIEHGLYSDGDEIKIHGRDMNRTVLDTLIYYLDEMSEGDTARMRELLSTGIFFEKGRELSPYQLVKNLRWELEVTEQYETINVTTITIQWSHDPYPESRSLDRTKTPDDLTVVDRLGIEGEDAFNYCTVCGASVPPGTTECPHCDCITEGIR